MGFKWPRLPVAFRVTTMGNICGAILLIHFGALVLTLFGPSSIDNLARTSKLVVRSSRGIKHRFLVEQAFKSRFTLIFIYIYRERETVLVPVSCLQ